MAILDILRKDNSVEGLRSQSEGVLSVFKKTIADLGNISKQALKEKAIKDEVRMKLAVESEQLGEIARENSIVISKFNALLSPERSSK
jgi:hypothetical protein